MAILLQVGGAIRRCIDTISGSSWRLAVSAVSLADSALLDPIELTQILRPRSLAPSFSFSLAPCLTSASLLSLSSLARRKFIHSRAFHPLRLPPSCPPIAAPFISFPPLASTPCTLFAFDSPIHSARTLAYRGLVSSLRTFLLPPFFPRPGPPFARAALPRPVTPHFFLAPCFFCPAPFSVSSPDSFTGQRSATLLFF